MKRLVFIFMILCSFHAVYAQEVKHYNNNALIRMGNILYEHNEFATAENAFQKALVVNSNNPIGYYNYGNTLMQQKKYEAARKSYQQMMARTNDKMLQAKALHNIGNTYCKEEKWKEAVEAYKSALRKNPADADTRYNLAYAQKMMQKDEQDKDKNKDKNKDKDKDKDKDKEDKKDKQDKKEPQKDKEDKDGQDKPNQQNPDKKDKDEQQTQGGQDKGPMEQKQADAILNALQQNEKKLQSNKNKQGVAPVKLDKDW